MPATREDSGRLTRSLLWLCLTLAFVIGDAASVQIGQLGTIAAKPQVNAETAATGAPLPAPDVPVAGPRQTWQDWSYVVPQNWQAQVLPDGVMIRAPKTNPRSQGGSFVFLLPLRAAKADPYAQGLEILGQVFAQNFASFRDYGAVEGSPYKHKMRGVNGDGWPYVMLRTRPVDFRGGRPSHKLRLLLFQLGSQVAPLVGFEHADEPALESGPGSSSVAWALLYHSLQFPTLRAPGSAGLRDKLIGTWSVGERLNLVEDTFNADGTYDHRMKLYPTFYDLSSARGKPPSWFGEGRFVVQGDRLSVWPGNRKPQTTLYRIVEEENFLEGFGPVLMLYRLGLSADGKEARESLMMSSK
jgi:hypothetical protein